MKVKTKDGWIGIFIKKIKGKEMVIISIMNEEVPLSEEHLTLSKKQAVKFLKRALEEIGEQKK